MTHKSKVLSVRPKREAWKKHGMSHCGPTPHRLYSVWAGMLQRCNNPRSVVYHNYGGRGIKVCPEWHSFQNFFNDVGASWVAGLTIERVDNDGDYCPKNFKWATRAEQLRNTRRSHLVTFGGITKTITDWNLSLGGGPNLIQGRLHLGWCLEDALTEPAAPRKRLKRKS